MPQLPIETPIAPSDSPSDFPGVAKVKKPAKRKKKKSTSGGSGSRGGSARSGSSRSSRQYSGEIGTSDRPIDTKQMAIAWARTGARMGIGLFGMEMVVEKEFWEDARRAYQDLYQELHSRPKVS